MLALWAIVGLTVAASGDSAMVFAFFSLWPWNLIILVAWVVVGVWVTINGLIEARHRRSWRVGLAFGLLPLLVLIGMLTAGRAAWSHPTDAAMIREFRHHRAEYEELLAIYRSDRQLGRIAPDFTRPANFFSGDSLPRGDPPTLSQLADIRKRCRRLRLVAGVEGYDDKRSVEFIRSTLGLAISGSTKGLMWSVERPALIVPNTDAYFPADGRFYTAYRLIDDHWYVYYGSTD